MNYYVTEIVAIDPCTNELKTWCGPHIPAISFTDAETYCQNNGLGYCKVTGQLIAEIGTKIENGYIVPDFNDVVDYNNDN